MQMQTESVLSVHSAQYSATQTRKPNLNRHNSPSHLSFLLLYSEKHLIIKVYVNVIDRNFTTQLWAY